MISWLDIVSLPLRRVHDQWVAVRGNRIMPDIGDYAGFAGRMPQGVSACIAVPAREPVPKFVFVGDVMRRYLPGCRSGIAVDEVPSVVTRISVSVPVHRVIKSSQPDSRRGQLAVGNRVVPFEGLMLPFGDGSNRVRLIHGIYELAARA
jgi:hypothetical protein